MARHLGEVAVIGLGRFGNSLAATLVQQGWSVLGIDRDRTIVQRLSDQCTQVVALDSTDEQALREVDISSFDTVVVAIGANFEACLLTTVALKSVGVRHVIAKAVSETQRHILLRVGADRVVLPEADSGRRLALELASPSVVEQLQLGDGHSILEIQAPPSMVRRTLTDVQLRGRYQVTLVAVKRGSELTVSPPSDFVFQEGDLLVLIGANRDLARLTAAET